MLLNTTCAVHDVNTLQHTFSPLKRASKARSNAAATQRQAATEESPQSPCPHWTSEQVLQTHHGGGQASAQSQGGRGYECRASTRWCGQTCATTGTRETTESSRGQAEGEAAASSSQVRGFKRPMVQNK